MSCLPVVRMPLTSNPATVCPKPETRRTAFRGRMDPRRSRFPQNPPHPTLVRSCALLTRPVPSKVTGFFVLQQSKIRQLRYVSPNSTAVCPIFDTERNLSAGYRRFLRVSTLATQYIAVLDLTYPTWGTSFTFASNLQRALPQGSDRVKQAAQAR